MGKEYIEDFNLLFFSFLKLEGIDSINVLHMAYTLYAVRDNNEFHELLSNLKIKKTIYNDYIVDIDDILMDAYLLGYLEQSDSLYKNILIDKEYVENTLLSAMDSKEVSYFKQFIKAYVKLSKSVNLDDKKTCISYVYEVLPKPIIHFKR